MEPKVNRRGRNLIQLMATAEERMGQCAGVRDWASGKRAKARARKDGAGPDLERFYDGLVKLNHARVSRLGRIVKVLAEMYARETLADFGIQVG